MGVKSNCFYLFYFIYSTLRGRWRWLEQIIYSVNFLLTTYFAPQRIKNRILSTSIETRRFPSHLDGYYMQLLSCCCQLLICLLEALCVYWWLGDNWNQWKIWAETELVWSNWREVILTLTAISTVDAASQATTLNSFSGFVCIHLNTQGS